MSFHVLVRPDVDRDIIEAEAWYNKQQPGLGAEFNRGVRENIRKLAADALIYPLRNRKLGVRWMIAGRFPYRIVYQVKQNTVIVLAVIHAARHDKEWLKRP